MIAAFYVRRSTAQKSVTRQIVWTQTAKRDKRGRAKQAARDVLGSLRARAANRRDDRREGRMRPFRLASALALMTLVMGCGSENPISPTAPMVAGLAITGADSVLTGVSADYTVAATLTDGTSRTVTPTWSSSNLAVAEVDSAGRLEGRAHGVTSLTASSGGQTAFKIVRVINNYTGTWEGRFVVNLCDAPPGWCAGSEVDFFSFPISLAVSQAGTDQSEVSATLILPSFSQIRANISGRVTSDGRLNLAGTSEVECGRGCSTWATFHVGAWDTTLSNGGMMMGRWAQRLSTFQPPSNVYMENELETMTRISNTAGPMSPR